MAFSSAFFAPLPLFPPTWLYFQSDQWEGGDSSERQLVPYILGTCLNWNDMLSEDTPLLLLTVNKTVLYLGSDA